VIHYHGTPITPREALFELAGRNFFVSFAEPRDIETVAQIGQSFALDNGAWSFYTTGKATDWAGFYAWAERWLEYRTAWAVIPDVIGGTEEENDALLAQWPSSLRRQGAPVWHLTSSVERLLRIVDAGWSRVCFGGLDLLGRADSSAVRRRLDEVFDALIPGGGPAPCWLHCLKGMSAAKFDYPFSSVDSTDVARNHKRHGYRPGTARAMAERWDSMNPPARWTPARWTTDLFGDTAA
jgi:hypothetical protein